MAHYRKIDVRIWNDAKFRGLSETGKFVFFFVLTHPHLTALGAMRATANGLAAELGIKQDRFSKAFAEAVSVGLLEYDEVACFVAAPNFLKYNPPESPNVVKSWTQWVDLLPECELKERLLVRSRKFVEAMPEGFAKGLPLPFRKTLAKGMPNQQQEQQQQQEQEQESNKPTTDKALIVNPTEGLVVGLDAEESARIWCEADDTAKRLGVPDATEYIQRVSALVSRGLIDGRVVAGCAAEAKKAAVENPVGLFRTKLRAAIKKLDAMTKAVEFTDDYLRGPPEENSAASIVADLANGFSRKDTP